MVKTQVEPMSKEEINSLLLIAKEKDEYYHTLFLLAKTTGRRLGELTQILVKDIDFDKGIMVTQVLKRRKRVEKEAILSPEVVSKLKKYVKNNKLKLDQTVFGNKSHRAIQKAVKVYAAKAGITKNFVFHNFRHYFVTELVRKGWSHDKIAKLTGHANPSTLANYDHAVASDIKEDALKALEDL